MSGPVLWPGGQLAQSGCIHSTKLSYHLQWALVPKLASAWSLHQAKSWAEKLSGGVLPAWSQNCAGHCQVPVDTTRFLIDTLRFQWLGVCLILFSLLGQMHFMDSGLIYNSFPFYFCAFCWVDLLLSLCWWKNSAFFHPKMWCLSLSIFHVAVLIRIHSTRVHQHVLWEDKSWNLAEDLCHMCSTSNRFFYYFFLN